MPRNKTNISKSLKVLLSVNYLMDTIITQSDMEVPPNIEAVVKNTTKVSYAKHKSSAIDIIVNNLNKWLNEAKEHGYHVEDTVALYLLLCTFSNDDMANLYGMHDSSSVLDSIKVEVTSKDIQNTMWLINKLLSAYKVNSLSSRSRVKFPKVKKIKKPRDVSKKVKTIKVKNKTNIIIKKKARKAEALAALRVLIEQAKKKEKDNKCQKRL